MMLKEYTGKWFFKNGKFIRFSKFDNNYLKHGKSFYEVLRIIGKKPLFLNDHIERLHLSLKNNKVSEKLRYIDFYKVIDALAVKNNIDIGNIKIVCNIFNGITIYLYFVPHRYPNAEQYNIGAALLSRMLERDNPRRKAVNLKLREKTESLIIEKNIYEVLLVDHNGLVTEGSKSNVFFIKNDVLYTPPIESVLPGITRKYILSICIKRAIKYIEIPVTYKNISSFESVFITGTSPKVLPVKTIDNIQFSVDNPVLRIIMDDYDRIIQESIEID